MALLNVIDDFMDEVCVKMELYEKPQLFFINIIIESGFASTSAVLYPGIGEEGDGVYD